MELMIILVQTTKLFIRELMNTQRVSWRERFEFVTGTMIVCRSHSRWIRTEIIFSKSCFLFQRFEQNYWGVRKQPKELLNKWVVASWNDTSGVPLSIEIHWNEFA